MAERKTQGRSTTAEERATRARQRAEHDQAALDNPDVPGEPSEIRNAAYFVGIVAFALVLNLVVLVVASGGQ